MYFDLQLIFTRKFSKIENYFRELGYAKYKSVLSLTKKLNKMAIDRTKHVWALILEKRITEPTFFESYRYRNLQLATDRVYSNSNKLFLIPVNSNIHLFSF